MTPLPRYAIPGSPEIALVLIRPTTRVDEAPQIVLSPNLRHSGLLHVLPTELLQVFIALLTFQPHTRSGDVKASVEQLAGALKLHPDLAEERLRQLAAYSFDEAPLLFEAGAGRLALSRRVAVWREANEQEPQAVDPIALASKEAVLQSSRERYSTPRAEAEALVAEQLGSASPEPIPEGREGELYHALLGVGVPEPETRQLLAEGDMDEIERQLEWLPERGARNPARFLVAAVRGRYESPEARRGRGLS